MWPSVLVASSEVLSHPGLVQCLALADAKQCDALVQSCLSQLIKPEGSCDVRNALVSPHLDKLVDGLRPETKDKIIRGLAGLPTNHKVGLDWYEAVLIFRMIHLMRLQDEQSFYCFDNQWEFPVKNVRLS